MDNICSITMSSVPLQNMPSNLFYCICVKV